MSETPLEAGLIMTNEILSDLSPGYVFTQAERAQLGSLCTLTSMILQKAYAQLRKNEAQIDSRMPNLDEGHNQSSDVL